MTTINSVFWNKIRAIINNNYELPSQDITEFKVTLAYAKERFERSELSKLKVA